MFAVLIVEFGEFVTSTAAFVNLHGVLVSLPFDFVSLLVKFQLSEFYCLVCEITS